MNRQYLHFFVALFLFVGFLFFGFGYHEAEAAAISITTSSPLPSATVGSTYSTSIQATGGGAVYTWSLAGGSLPPGLSLKPSVDCSKVLAPTCHPSFDLSGAPTQAGTYTFSVSVWDRYSIVSKTFTLTVFDQAENTAPVISSCSLSGATIAVGSSATLNYSVSDPDGDAVTVTINWGDSGPTSIGGVSSTQHTYYSPGTYSVSITVKDSKGASASRSCGSITVRTNNPPLISFVSLSKTAVTEGEAITLNYTLSDIDGDNISSSVNWGDGTLLNLTLLGPGEAKSFSHTYSAAGSYTIKINAYDSFGASSPEVTAGTITVTKSLALAITTSSPLPSATVGSTYSTSIQATGGGAVYTWSLAGGSLPPGLSFGPSVNCSQTGPTCHPLGVIIGAPTTAGDYTFTVSVYDGQNTVSKTFTLKVFGQAENTAPQISSCSLSGATIAVGSSATLNYSVSDPDGDAVTVSINWGDASPLQIGGASSAQHAYYSAGTYNVSITAKDSKGASASQNCGSVDVGIPSVSLSADQQVGIAPLTANFTVDLNYLPSCFDFFLDFGDGSSGITEFRVCQVIGDPGTLGVVKSQTRSYTHIYSKVGSYSASASANGIKSNLVPITVTFSSVPVITTTSLPQGVVNVPYSAPIQAQGGGAVYSWVITSGSLPPGLSSSPSVDCSKILAPICHPLLVISGTPTTTGIYTFTISVTDNLGKATSKEFTINVVLAPQPSLEPPQTTPPFIGQPPLIVQEGVVARTPARTVAFGQRGDEVRSLQALLAQNKEIYPAGLTTGYFGPLTREAVKRFQCRYNIVCSGDEITTGYGHAGPITRAKLKEVFGR